MGFRSTVVMDIIARSTKLSIDRLKEFQKQLDQFTHFSQQKLRSYMYACFYQTRWDSLSEMVV
jgi:hypothetical protein